jgi:hypothetical protein
MSELDGFTFSIHASPAAAIVRGKFAQGEHLRTLRRLILDFPHHKATNILDKVYALHGLASDSSDLIIDYRISPEELWIRVLRHSFISRWRPKAVSVLSRLMAKVLKLDWSPEEPDSRLNLATEHAPSEAQETPASLLAQRSIDAPPMSALDNVKK